MDDGKFWVLTWSIIATAIIAVASIIAISAVTNSIQVERIRAQALTDNPSRSALDVTCALERGGQSDTVCAVRASK